MSRFTEIEAFLQVADCASFTMAAEKLMVSRSRVSQMVASLEARLGVTLLQRTTRTVTLTPEGERFAEQCRVGMRELASAEANLKMAARRLTGPVRINAIGGIYGEKYLAEALSEIAVKHPELQFTIDYTSVMVDLNKSPVDLILRIGTDPGDGVEAVCLATVEHSLCATPAFLHQHGYPQTPEALEALPLVCGTPKTWSLRHRRTGVQKTLTPQAHWRSGNTAAQKVAVEASLGAGRLLTKVVEPSLRSGRLLPILPDWAVEPTYLWLLWATNSTLPHRIEVVRDHIVHWFEDH